MPRESAANSGESADKSSKRFVRMSTPLRRAASISFAAVLLTAENLSPSSSDDSRESVHKVIYVCSLCSNMREIISIFWLSMKEVDCGRKSIFVPASAACKTFSLSREMPAAVPITNSPYLAQNFFNSWKASRPASSLN